MLLCIVVLIRTTFRSIIVHITMNFNKTRSGVIFETLDVLESVFR